MVGLKAIKLAKETRIKKESEPFERKTEAGDVYVFGQTHGQQHFRSEHARIANLDPLGQSIVVRENFHRRLSVRVVRRLEAQFPNTCKALEYRIYSNLSTVLKLFRFLATLCLN
jgi:hypothetical protein